MRKLNSPSPSRPLPRGMLLCLTLTLLVSLTGCLTVKPTLMSGISNPACLAIKIVRFSKDDTPETVQAIRENNAALRVLCPEQTGTP